MKNIQKQIIGAVAIIAVGTALRIAMSGMPNIEPITVIAILAGSLMLRKELAIIIPLGIVICSDIIIGNTAILASTWTAWAIIGVGALLLRGTIQKKTYPLYAISGGLVANIFFFLWTNAGVWLQTTMYPKTAAGLIQSYTMGLPFLRDQVVSNIIFLSLASLVVMAVQSVKVFRAEKVKKIENKA